MKDSNYTYSKEGLNTIIYQEFNVEDILSGLEQDGVGFSIQDYLEEEYDHQGDLASLVGKVDVSEKEIRDNYSEEYRNRLEEHAHLLAQTFVEDYITRVKNSISRANRLLDYMELALINGKNEGFSVIVNIYDVDVKSQLDNIADGADYTKYSSMSLARGVDVEIANYLLHKVSRETDGVLVDFDGEAVARYNKEQYEPMIEYLIKMKAATGDNKELIKEIMTEHDYDVLRDKGISELLKDK